MYLHAYVNVQILYIPSVIQFVPMQNARVRHPVFMFNLQN